MICGIDEAGRGPVMGPMVVSGVLLEDETQLKMMNVKDSKKCTPKRREKLAQMIRDIADIETIIVPAKDIDTLRQSFTMNKIEGKLFASIIDRLRPEVAYVDSADVNEETFRVDIKSELDFKVDIISRHGADILFPIVSAASIMAKTIRDAEIVKIKEEIGQDIGSGYPSDRHTIQFLETWISEYGTPPPHTRLSWKTTQRLMDRLRTRNIDEF
jgi:ribonuclease HII